ncbi:MAG: hypothetical protein OXN97_08965 [Bryobacterales bacterium]|nr:hypothetical protein [Bryobacterales bacterium]
MSDWDAYDSFGDTEPVREPRSTVRQLAIRFVALLLLASFLGSLYVVFRGIQDILVVIGILLAVALFASLLRKQRESENPYSSDGQSDFDIH